MKRLLLLLTICWTIILGIGLSSSLKAQCTGVKIIADKSQFCPDEKITLYAKGTVDSLKASLKSNNSQRGNMFHIVAKRDITLFSFDGVPNATTNYALYYRRGKFTGHEHDSADWIALGRTKNVIGKGPGTLVPIPIKFQLHVKSGDTISFYLSSTTSVVQYYLDGTKYDAVYAQDSNLMFLEGIGFDWPFGGADGKIYSPRIWNGRIHYRTNGKLLWSTGDTTTTITVSRKTDTTFYVQKKTATCTTRDSFKVSIYNGKPDLGNDSILCTGNSLVLKAKGVPTGSTYSWTPGITTAANRTITKGGTYYLSITTPEKCVFSDTIDIKQIDPPVVNLGPDTYYCTGDSLKLDAGFRFNNYRYKWNVGNTERIIYCKTTGTYTANVTDTLGCTGSDKIVISEKAAPVVDLGTDQIICDKESVMLDAQNIGSSYDWNTSDNSRVIYASKTGKYSVKVTNTDGCVGTDEINITVNPLPDAYLGNDTMLCEGQSLIIGTENYGNKANYIWNTFEKTQTITVNKSGTYAVELTDSNGCKDFDDMVVTFKETPVVDLGGDQDLCEGSMMDLDAGYFDSETHYVWSNGNDKQIITITKGGRYAVKVIDSLGCTDSASVVVKLRSVPTVDLPEDFSICLGDSVMLDAGVYNGYLWNGTVKTRVYWAKIGTNTLRVFNEYGCDAEDKVEISKTEDAIADFKLWNIGGLTIQFDNKSTGATNFTWDFGDGKSSASENPKHEYAVDSVYTVTLTAENECGTDVKTFKFSPLKLSVDQITESLMTVNPNPTSGTITMQLMDEQREATVFVRSMDGKIVFQSAKSTFTSGAYTFTLPEKLPSGIYLFHFQTNQGVYSKTIILNR